jgi:hypothetical protein
MFIVTLDALILYNLQLYNTVSSFTLGGAILRIDPQAKMEAHLS